MSSSQNLTQQYSGVVIPTLKGVAVVCSFLSAGSLTTAYRLLPSIYPLVQKSPQDAAKMWKVYYDKLSAVVPVSEITAFLVSGTLTYIEYKKKPFALPWKLWASTTVLIPPGWVWVRTLMLTPSNNLLDVAAEKDGDKIDSKSEKNKTMHLLKQFNSLIGVRMLLPWVFGGFALGAILIE